MAKEKTRRPATHKEDPIISVREAAKLMGKSPQTVGRWIRDGLMRALRRPDDRVIGVRRSTVDAILSSSDLDPPTEAKP